MRCVDADESWLPRAAGAIHGQHRIPASDEEDADPVRDRGGQGEAAERSLHVPGDPDRRRLARGAGAAGGLHNVIFADIEQLYDQYSMGIKHHPAAIVNFLRQCFHELPEKPSNVLLLGSATAHYYPASHEFNFIPTLGRPNSDNLLAAGLNVQGQYGFYPELPIGRVAAINDQELTVYLDKVKQHDAVGRTAWKKKVLHFVGGDSEFLSSSLSAFMGNYERIIEDTLFGAEVRTFRKNSSTRASRSGSLLPRNARSAWNRGSAATAHRPVQISSDGANPEHERPSYQIGLGLGDAQLQLMKAEMELLIHRIQPCGNQLQVRLQVRTYASAELFLAEAQPGHEILACLSAEYAAHCARDR